MQYGSLRLGLYEPIKSALSVRLGSVQQDGKKRNTSLLVKIVAGGLSGALAAAITNPIELIKVAAQSDSTVGMSGFSRLRSIVSQRGVTALWTGVSPSIQRAALLTGWPICKADISRIQLIISFDF